MLLTYGTVCGRLRVKKISASKRTNKALYSHQIKQAKSDRKQQEKLENTPVSDKHNINWKST